jgi:hypothetical protein
MADLKELVARYSELSDSERNLLKKELAAAEQKRKDAKAAAEAQAVMAGKAKAKIGSDALYGDVAAQFKALLQSLKALGAASSPQGAKAVDEVRDALGRAAGLLASGSKALVLTGEEQALIPAPKPVAKKAAKRGK